ncbi:MAG: endonuclease/exonuclease/phosphatase family protein [Thermoguttaceae bacterium]|nr:endonuclease/exonuclease/phosphatase family protein [Thermoguttaceae bacterium]
MLRRNVLKIASSLFVATFALFSTLGANAADDSDPIKLRVLTYNIQIGRAPGGSYSDPAQARLDKTGNVVKASDPDVAGLQEVDCKTERSGVSVDHLGVLSELTGLIGTFAPKTKLPGGDYGIGTLSKTAPIQSRFVHMKGSAHTRVLQLLEFERFVFFNTHLPLTQEKRLAAVAVIEEEAKKYEKPIILVGDLNAEPDSQEIQELEKNWKNLGPEEPTFPSPEPTVRIDYIFLRNAKSFKVLESEVIPDPETSDHRPVFCVVEFE